MPVAPTPTSQGEMPEAQSESKRTQEIDAEVDVEVRPEMGQPVGDPVFFSLELRRGQIWKPNI
jgi:hypothetical protein